MTMTKRYAMVMDDKVVFFPCATKDFEVENFLVDEHKKSGICPKMLVCTILSPYEFSWTMRRVFFDKNSGEYTIGFVSEFPECARNVAKKCVEYRRKRNPIEHSICYLTKYSI